MDGDRPTRSGRTSQTRGIEFFFAQFVDMYARPSAKLDPGSREPRRPRRGRRRVRRVRRRRDRPGAERSRTSPRSPTSTASRPSRGSRTSRASPATSRSRARRGRTARARSCGACSRERDGAGYEFKIGLELEYFLVRQREDGAIEIADPLDTLEKPCYDMAGLTRQLRLPHDGLAVLQRARLGQLRERPRGRERAVRAELHLRRRARHAATARSSSATWCTRSPSSTACSRRSCRSRSRT